MSYDHNQKCPNCNGRLTYQDSGEPLCIDGLWCEDCDTWFDPEDLEEDVSPIEPNESLKEALSGDTLSLSELWTELDK